MRLEREAMQIEGQIGQLRAREAMLRGMQSAQDGTDSGVRFLLGEDGDDGRQHAVEGLVGLVQDIVRVPPGLERAIEAALAENVQALVFENLPLALQAIETLEQREAGAPSSTRWTSSELAAAEPDARERRYRRRGAPGPLRQPVPAPGRCAARPHHRRGERSLAQQVLRRGLGSVVTMDGVLLRPNGALSGGLNSAAGESFSRQRELEELPGEISRAEERAADLDVALKREQQRLEGVSESLERIEPRLHELREERSRRQSGCWRIAAA